MTFSSFERAAIKILLEGRVPKEVLDVALGPDLLVTTEHTGVGYSAEAKHWAFPAARAVFSTPFVTGEFDDMIVGFLVFIEDQTLTLECHGVGDDAFPADARSLDWTISSRTNQGRR